MKNNLMTSIRRKCSVLCLWTKKHAPEILTGIGAAGSVVSCVMACKATLELDDTLDECHERIDNYDAEWNDEDINNNPSEYKKGITKITFKNAWEVGKLYLPAAGIEAASLGMIFASNGIHLKRNASLSAAYGTLNAMYNRYRQNVKDTFGEEVDHDMRFGIKHETTEEEVIDDKGKKHKVKTTTDIIEVDPNDPNYISDYAKFYQDGVGDFDKYNPEYNLMRLKAIQSYCNQKLIAQGYLFLNDVYKEIGIDETKAGRTVGWIYDPDKNVDNDNYIDFGLYKNRTATMRFINGQEPVVLLDFNVDGDIVNDPKLWNLLKFKMAVH